MRFFRTLVSFIIIFALLFFQSPNYSPAASGKSACSKIVYGKTGKGRDLVYYKIEPENEGKKIKSTNKVLISFEIHGFEDLYSKDGKILVDIGNYVVDYFLKNKDKLKATTLYVIPMTNPDGLLNGTTNNGKGRCQISLGIDINRDFDYKFKHFNSSRYKTLNHPFGSPEAKALKDLVLSIKPNTVVDFHGWLNMTIGDKGLAKVFHDELNLKYSCGYSYKTPGYFAAWASTHCKASLMVEYPRDCTKNPAKYKSLTVNALCAIFK